MYRPENIDAIVFDIGGVFVVPAPEPLQSILAAAGIEATFDAHAARWAHYRGIHAITELIASKDLHEGDPSMWVAYDRAYFSAVGVAPDQIDAAQRARAASRSAPDRPKVARVWSQVLENNRDALGEIATHRPIAVVSNNDGTAAQQCADQMICQVGPGPHVEVAALVDSGVVGISKPDPRIFTPALDALGTDAARTLYVGDTVHADVRGATAAGMPVVQLDPYELHADHQHWTVPDLVALVAWVSG